MEKIHFNKQTYIGVKDSFEVIKLAREKDSVEYYYITVPLKIHFL